MEQDSITTNQNKTVVIVTGGMDPIHEGHIEYIKAAKNLGDILVVGLNSDSWLERKKGKAFQNFKTRSAIVESIRYVDKVIDFNDDDGSARDAIAKVQKEYGPYCRYIFANGGDRTATNIPEMEGTENVIFAFGVGGENKLNSSSKIIEEWNGKN